MPVAASRLPPNETTAERLPIQGMEASTRRNALSSVPGSAWVFFVPLPGITGPAGSQLAGESERHTCQLRPDAGEEPIATPPPPAGLRTKEVNRLSGSVGTARARKSW